MIKYHSYNNKTAKKVHDECKDNPLITQIISNTDCSFAYQHDKIFDMTSRELTQYLSKHPKVKEVMVATHPDERAIRGVKAGLRSMKRKLAAKEFHETHGHLGYVPGCKICAMTKQKLRRIYKTVDPHR